MAHAVGINDSSSSSKDKSRAERSSFLSLPMELRWRIYQFLFADAVVSVEMNTTTATDDNNGDPKPTIVCEADNSTLPPLPALHPHPSPALTLTATNIPHPIFAVSRLLSADLAASHAAAISTLTINCPTTTRSHSANKSHSPYTTPPTLTNLLAAIPARHPLHLQETHLPLSATHALDLVALLAQSQSIYTCQQRPLQIHVQLPDADVHWDYRPRGWFDLSEGDQDGAWCANVYVLRTLAGRFFRRERCKATNDKIGDGDRDRATAFTVQACQRTTFWRERRRVGEVVTTHAIGPALVEGVSAAVVRREIEMF